jgi:hypothetical protein
VRQRTPSAIGYFEVLAWRHYFFEEQGKAWNPVPVQHRREFNLPIHARSEQDSLQIPYDPSRFARDGVELVEQLFDEGWRVDFNP